MYLIPKIGKGSCPEHSGRAQEEEPKQEGSTLLLTLFYEYLQRIFS